MARLIYTLVLIFLTPFIVLRLFWKARRQREYLDHFGERWGQWSTPNNQSLIWIHAVSVGETRAAQPLVAALKARYPDHQILMTHMTPTGRETSRALFGDTILRAYLPYDYPWLVKKFLQHFQPRLGILLETELWPNLIAGCQQHTIPLALINARLSEKSARGYRKIGALARDAFGSIRTVAAQTQADAQRLTAAGARHVEVMGNLKFDCLPPSTYAVQAKTLRALWGNRPTWLAASTRDGEEALILDALRQSPIPEALLVIVPRHPQRFDEVAALARARGWRVQRRSEVTPIAKDTEIVIGDSMGEMFAYYASCDVAFIGGSLLDFGSQNLIEACAVGKPVIIGPSTYNFSAAAEEAIHLGAAKQIQNAEALIVAVTHLLNAPSTKSLMGDAGLHFANTHRGATDRAMKIVQQFLS